MTQKWIVSIGCLIALAACGDDNQKSGAPGENQLVQDIRQTDYALKNASWKVTIVYEDGSSETLVKQTAYRDGKSKDHVQRILDSGQFYIFTNDVKAERITITPEGNLKDDQSTIQRLPGCNLSGRSQMSGRATHAQLQLNWNLNAQLDGGGCETVTSLKEQFQQFIESEVTRLNLRSGQDLLKAMEQNLQSARRVTLELSINGEMNLPKETQ